MPIFVRDHQRQLPAGAMARDGYAVGVVKIYARSYVNAPQLVFMRVRDDGQLDPADTYTSDWIGARGKGTPHTLSGEGAPIIGIHVLCGKDSSSMRWHWS